MKHCQSSPSLLLTPPWSFSTSFLTEVTTVLNQGLPTLTRVSVLTSLYWSAPAAVTKHHRLVGLNHGNFLSQGSGGWKCQIKTSAGFVPPEASLLGLQVALFPLHACLWSLSPNFSFLEGHWSDPWSSSCARLCPGQLFPEGHQPYWTRACLLSWPHLTSLKSMSKYSHNLRHRKLGLQHVSSGGHDSAHNTQLHTHSSEDRFFLVL